MARSVGALVVDGESAAIPVPARSTIRSIDSPTCLRITRHSRCDSGAEIRRIDTVTHVTNDLVVMPKAPLSSRSKDALISTKVKAALIENRDVQSGVFKVYTERGTVYLLGRVTDLEGRIAVELARNVTGVERVVKMFEVITPEEARRLAPGTNPPDAPR